MNMKDEMSKEFDIDLETANRIAKEYPSLSDSARERMFNMTKKKINITNKADEDNNNSVHGVEKYNRPRWIKFAGMAAAVAIIAGSIGGGNYLLHKMNDSAPPEISSSETEPATASSSSMAETVISSSSSMTTAANGSSTIKSVSTTAVTESSVITSTTTTAETTTTAATSAIVEATTEVTDTKNLTPEEAAHKLTDNYWSYECFFHTHSHSMTSSDAKGLSFGYTYHHSYNNEEWTGDTKLTYCKTDDERLTDSTMDSLKKIYNTYYSKNYDPFHIDTTQDTNGYELFGPSFTADTLPADKKLDHEYTFIEYEGELYQKIIPSHYSADEHWSDDRMDITDVTEKSFTLKRKIHNPPIDWELPGEFTFKIVFDEDVQDWRIEQIDVEYEYPDNITS